MNKAKVYECVEVKGKMVKKGKTIRYWDPVDMGMFMFFFIGNLIDKLV